MIKNTKPASARSYLHEASFLHHEILHHPVGNVNFSLVSHELQDAAVGGLVDPLIGQFEEHRVDNIKSGELVQGRWWHDDLPPALHVRPLGAGQHGHGVAAVLGIERSGDLREEIIHTEHD